MLPDDDDLNPAEQGAAVEPLEPVSDPIGTARRRHGAAGAVLAAGMFGLDAAINGRKVKEEAPIIVEAATQPVDIEKDGIRIPLDEFTDLVAPPQPRHDPFARKPSRRR